MASPLARQPPKSGSGCPLRDAWLPPTVSRGSGFEHLFLTPSPTKMHEWSITYCLYSAFEPIVSCNPFYLVIPCSQQLGVCDYSHFTDEKLSPRKVKCITKGVLHIPPFTLSYSGIRKVVGSFPLSF